MYCLFVMLNVILFGSLSVIGSVVLLLSVLVVSLLRKVSVLVMIVCVLVGELGCVFVF